MLQVLVLVGLALVVGLLACWLDPCQREGRKFEAELTTREPVSDAEMVARYFATDEVAPEIPAKARRVFAQYMPYPAEKLLPDDDFMFYFA